MLCEVVALGCLVAHGDTTATRRLQKAYKADDILKRLEELHPDFYPVPFEPQFGINALNMSDMKGDFLRKEDLVRLYGKCGDVLHKGNLQKMLSAKPQVLHEPYKEVGFWGQKILNLLSVHRISRLGNRFHLITFRSLKAPGYDQANIQVSIAEGAA
jgi:hypothetical protein